VLSERRDVGAATDDLGLLDEGRALTFRQDEIIGLIAAGYTDKEIARDLSMSRATVHTHLARLFARFGVHSRAALVACWIRRAYVPRGVTHLDDLPLH
jgi:DNA-binding NarL/FixJ family response regulator